MFDRTRLWWKFEGRYYHKDIKDDPAPAPAPAPKKTTSKTPAPEEGDEKKDENPVKDIQSFLEMRNDGAF